MKVCVRSLRGFVAVIFEGYLWVSELNFGMLISKFRKCVKSYHKTDCAACAKCQGSAFSWPRHSPILTTPQRHPSRRGNCLYHLLVTKCLKYLETSWNHYLFPLAETGLCQLLWVGKQPSLTNNPGDFAELCHHAWRIAGEEDLSLASLGEILGNGFNGWSITNLCRIKCWELWSRKSSQRWKKRSRPGLIVSRDQLRWSSTKCLVNQHGLWNSNHVRFGTSCPGVSMSALLLHFLGLCSAKLRRLPLKELVKNGAAMNKQLKDWPDSIHAHMCWVTDVEQREHTGTERAESKVLERW